MKIKLPEGYSLDGPYFKYSSPYGKVVESLNRQEWFVSREVPKTKTTDAFEILRQKYGKTIGVIEKFDNEKNRYIITQTYPTEQFKTLQKAINFLIKNEGKIVYCS